MYLGGREKRRVVLPLPAVFPCLVGNASQKELHYDYIGNLSQDMSFEYWVVPNSCRTTLFREFVKMEETQFMVWELFHLNQLCIDS